MTASHFVRRSSPRHLSPSFLASTQISGGTHIQGEEVRSGIEDVQSEKQQRGFIYHHCFVPQCTAHRFITVHRIVPENAIRTQGMLAYDWSSNIPAIKIRWKWNNQLKKTFKNIQNFQWENHLTAFYSLNYKNDKLKAILYLMKHKWSNNVDRIFFHISICTHIKSS